MRAPRSAEEASHYAQVRVSIDRQFDQIYGQLTTWNGSSTGTVFIPQEIRQFCQITGDPNSIHDPDRADAVLPGMMELASLWRYLDGSIPASLEGHKTVIVDVAAKFESFVKVGASLSLQYHATDFDKKDFVGPKIHCEFIVLAGAKNITAVRGTLTIHFMQDRIYERLLRNACQ